MYLCAGGRCRTRRGDLAGSVGIVIERRRAPDELDGFSWYCETAGTVFFSNGWRCAISNSIAGDLLRFYPASSIAPAAFADCHARRPP